MKTQNKRIKIKTKRKSRKSCFLCKTKIDAIDYKDLNSIRRFVSDRGKILPRRITGTCAKHQRVLSTAIKRARFIGLVAYSID